MRMINLDMDGVVADFNKWVGELLKREVSWEGRDLSDEEWTTLASQDHLYFQLPLIIESRKLVLRSLKAKREGIFDLRFLTAIPRRTTMPTAEQDKRDWLLKYFPGIPMEIGPYSQDKQKWCKPLDILVDDKHTNVTQWADKGGVSVYHTGNWEETLANFEEALTIDKACVLGTRVN